ncbi:MAG: hypothetical protein O3C57_03365 [Verrucomicrobia bacterium]|nr:hypothetical protein [Verrucomicrobiota bacterium]
MKALIVLLIAVGMVGFAILYPFTTCEPCRGQGKIEASWQKVKCGDCGGKGYRSSRLQKKGIKSMGGNRPMCLTCKGAGHIMRLTEPGGTCLACSGQGKISGYDILTRSTE